MFHMKDKIKLASDLGPAIKAARTQLGLKAIHIARDSGRSRNVLHRLERGEDVEVSSLFDILRAMNLCIRLESCGLPTMEEMAARFGGDDA
ncbi:MAG: helix-turn-helix domain-containing protein [Burkholderiales bacterium]|nr:helix-turn-helix domain-containing protein [Burkholderiales bacterium]